MRAWAALGWRRKYLLGIIGVAAILAGFGLQAWWTAWTPWLTLRTPAGNDPLAFSGDGSTVVTTSPGGLDLWDPRDGRKRAGWSSPDGRRWPYGKFSVDGRVFAATSVPINPASKASVDLIDVATGRVRWSIAPSLMDLAGFAFRDEDRSLRLLSMEKTSREWIDVDVATGLTGPSRPVSCPFVTRGIALSDDGRVLAQVDNRTNRATFSEDVILWDLDRDCQVSMVPGPGLGESNSSFCLSPDGHTLAVARRRRTVEIWDVKTARRRSEWTVQGPGFQPWMMFLSPDGTRLASYGLFAKPVASIDTLRFLHQRVTGNRNPLICELSVVDLVDGQVLGRSRTEGMRSVFSRDGRALATSSDESATRVHDLTASPGP